MKKTYILKKDTPDAKAGTRFNYKPEYGTYWAENAEITPYGNGAGNIIRGSYVAKDVENNPEWFREDKVIDQLITELCTSDSGCHGVTDYIHKDDVRKLALIYVGRIKDKIHSKVCEEFRPSRLSSDNRHLLNRISDIINRTYED